MSDKNGTVNCERPGCNKEIPADLAVYVKKGSYCPGECAEWIMKFYKKMASISNSSGQSSVNDPNMFKSKKLNSALGLKPTKYRTHL